MVRGDQLQLVENFLSNILWVLYGFAIIASFDLAGKYFESDQYRKVFLTVGIAIVFIILMMNQLLSVNINVLT